MAAVSFQIRYRTVFDTEPDHQSPVAVLKIVDKFLRKKDWASRTENEKLIHMMLHWPGASLDIREIAFKRKKQMNLDPDPASIYLSLSGAGATPAAPNPTKVIWAKHTYGYLFEDPNGHMHYVHVEILFSSYTPPKLADIVESIDFMSDDVPHLKED